MNQPNLFDDSRLARRSDPPTSKAAAAEIVAKLPRLQAAMYGAFRAIGPCTAQEAAVWCQLKYGGVVESYRKRKAELHRAGLIQFHDVRPCTINGNNAETWKVR